jgi:hypothetical protein
MFWWVLVGFFGAIWMALNIAHLRIRLWCLRRTRYANGLREWPLPRTPKQQAAIDRTIKRLLFFGSDAS